MHRTSWVAVALLNVAWVFFFLQPDPFEVFLHKRSSSEEVIFGEFCIQPQFDESWTSAPHAVTVTARKTNMTNTTAEGRNSTSSDVGLSLTINKTAQDCQCNQTTVHLKDLQLLDIALRPLAPGCEPNFIMTFPNMEVCVDGNTSFVELGLLTVDMNETTPVSRDVAETKVTPDPGLTETRPSAAPVYTSTHHSKGPDGATGAAEHAITGRNFSSSEVETIEKTKTVQDCLCKDGKGLQKDEQLLDIALRPPAAECDPKIIMTFPTVEACVDVEDFLAAVSPPPASVKQDDQVRRVKSAPRRVHVHPF